MNDILRMAVVAAAAATGATPASAQWTNRYPKVDGFNHHVYLEGYELPTLTVGPIDPAPSPDGQSVAFASRGWIWILDVAEGTARRLTSGAEVDARPTWSPDGERLAFVRDDGSDTWIVIRDIRSGAERTIDTPAIELDPAFSADGVALYYSSAAGGTIDLWSRALDSGQDTRLTTQLGTELRPQPHPDGARIVYLAKAGSNDMRIRTLGAGGETVLQSERITSMTRPALSPDGRLIAYNWPTQERYELRVLAIEQPTTSVLLTASDGLPLTPAWSADGGWIYFAEADDRQIFRLKRIRSAGGSVETVPIRRWDWQGPTGTLRIVTRGAGSASPVAARLSVVDETGHPAIPGATQSRFDGQNGRVFFYSPGVVEVTVPAGGARVAAVRGLTTPEAIVETSVGEGEIREVTLNLVSVWDAAEHGWLSGDHHFHLNYGGPYRLAPDDLPPMMAGEALDVATPLVANLHNRFEDQRLWGPPSSGTVPMYWFGQEVRSHFLGHVGLIGVTELFWPWIWGPGYQVYGADDRPNTEPLRHTRAQGGLSVYVHPIFSEDPFTTEDPPRVPVELVVDGVLGEFDLLEIACLWSDELATSALWYRFLNIGVPIAPSAGTDVMNNFYRTMAVGVTRVYVRTNGATNWSVYADGLRSGRSFVTTGPIIDFTAAGSGPGGTVPASSEVAWRIDLHSAGAVDRVELLVNGTVMWADNGLSGAGNRTYEGTIAVPEGGWIAARARGGETAWPAMGNYPFAHTAPVWIGSVGSTAPHAQQTAATELLRLLDVAQDRLRAGYGATPTPNIEERFTAARRRLQSLTQP